LSSCTDLRLQGDRGGIECVDLQLNGAGGSGDVINLRLEARLVEVPTAARLTTRLETPLSGIPVRSAPFPPKALAGLVAATVLVNVLIPVKV